MQSDEAASPAKKRKPTKKAEVIQLDAVSPRTYKALRFDIDDDDALLVYLLGPDSLARSSPTFIPDLAIRNRGWSSKIQAEWPRHYLLQDASLNCWPDPEAYTVYCTPI